MANIREKVQFTDNGETRANFGLKVICLSPTSESKSYLYSLMDMLWRSGTVEADYFEGRTEPHVTLASLSLLWVKEALGLGQTSRLIMGELRHFIIRVGEAVNHEYRYITLNPTGFETFGRYNQVFGIAFDPNQPTVQGIRGIIRAETSGLLRGLRVQNEPLDQISELETHLSFRRPHLTIARFPDNCSAYAALANQQIPHIDDLEFALQINRA